ncbi:MAG: HD domain-containing protein [Bacteroidales bacterium]|nr:HD domain-containing protein [Bacteroidales bacterium]
MTDNELVVDEYKEELFKNFFAQLPENFKTAEIHSQIRAVYDFAYKAHYGVRRKGGKQEPYITHPVSVALIVANEIGLGISSVLSALLHDVVEDTEYTREDIASQFGESIANIVEGLTKITNVYDAKQNTQAETFKKMLLSIPHDARVAFIKIADRLHNMRTMDEMPDGTRQIKAGENLYVYVPIAYQLGLYDIKNELEDTSFKYAHPGRYIEMAQYVEATATARNELISNFKLSLMRVLVRTGITCRLAVITKSLFTTWSMMQETGKTFQEIDNYQTVRIVFDPETDEEDEIFNTHYRLYASVINNFPEKTDSKRDYVLAPKKNGFKALVFQVMFGGNWVEVQILTAEDDMVARRGYSLKKANRSGLDVLKQNLQTFDPHEDASDLMNRFRSLSSISTIFVFTPKGDILELPKGSTVLDFAFAIHDKMGQHCLGASLGQKIVPINYVLKTTDQATILTSPSTKPCPEWLEYAKSDKARQWLENFFKQNSEKDKSEIVRGRQEFNKLMRDNRVIPNLILTSKILAHYKLNNNDELYRKIARQEISFEELIDCIKRIKSIIDGTKLHRREGNISAQNNDRNSRFVEIDYKKPLLIDKNIPYMLSACCYPIAGDDALACTDEDGVVFIHKRECENARKLSATKGKQTTKVIWGEDIEPALASINVQGTDRKGIIKDIATLLFESNIGIKSIDMSEDDGVFVGTILLYVTNTSQLDIIISQLTTIQGIVKANRINHSGDRS